MSTLAALTLALAPAPASLSATLILFRDTAEPLLFKATLSIDGTEIGRLGEKRFLAVALPPGPHRIEARWPALAGHRPAMVTVRVAADTVSYVELTGTAAFWRTPASTALVRRPEADGQTKVSACCKPAH
jgi:hypothetical protein